MDAKGFSTPEGSIAYWVSPAPNPALPWLVFLPGLTADHRLFDPQISYFDGKPPRANCLVWDPPSHGASRPFALTWSLDDLAHLLHGLLATEAIANPVLVGQSMGGYTAQAFMDLYPGEARGFVSIDSCPLQRSYYTCWELAALRHTKLMYLSFPWKTLVHLGSTGNATTPYGQDLMRSMMLDYRKRPYCELAAHGMRAVSEAVAQDRPYAIDCPALLICGARDRAGSARRYNRQWERRTGMPVHWIADAGHTSNTDKPQEVNRLIEEFLKTLA